MSSNYLSPQDDPLDPQKRRPDDPMTGSWGHPGGASIEPPAPPSVADPGAASPVTPTSGMLDPAARANAEAFNAQPPQPPMGIPRGQPGMQSPVPQSPMGIPGQPGVQSPHPASPFLGAAPAPPAPVADHSGAGGGRQGPAWGSPAPTPAAGGQQPQQQMAQRQGRKSYYGEQAQ